jgi:Ni,Fe-hydrogenase I cytochrome b subunit
MKEIRFIDKVTFVILLSILVYQVYCLFENNFKTRDIIWTAMLIFGLAIQIKDYIKAGKNPK